MAASAEENGGKKAPGGNAMDALTPPTMKNAQGGEQTLMNPSVATPVSAINPGSSTARSKSSPGNSSSIEGVVLSMAAQDLTGERLLQAATRVESHGRLCPTLKGIPLLAKLGQGGMGAVYYGVHPRLRSEVAVKVLPFHLAEQDPQMIRRFYREAQIAAQVRSPYLVNVTDVDEECGLFFLVMEYVNGNTAGSVLKSVIKGGRPGLPESEVLEICIAATEGLNAAHVNGIIHRDIKPDNIMIPYQSKSTQAYDLNRSKLMDLGLARSEEGNGGQSLTGVQTAMGTPGYMAPEQALDAKTADKRSDIFSMGATIFALLAGGHPFQRDATMKVLMATMHEPHEMVTKLRPDCSETLSEVINRCLEKKQENRYADAQQLSRALRNARKLLAAKTQIGGGSNNDDDDVEPPTVVYAANKGDRSDTSSQATMAGSVKPMTGMNGAPRKKGMLYVAAGGVALVLIGGGVMMARNKPGGTDIAIVKPPSAEDDEKYRERLDSLRDALESAEEKKVSGNLNSAKTWVTRAKKIKDIKDASLIARLSTLEKWLAAEENKEQYIAKMRAADLSDQEGKFDDALKSLREITDKGLASTDKEKEAAKVKKTLVENEIEARDFKKQAAEQPADKLDKKLDLLNSVLKNFPTDVEALDMKKQCDALLKEQKDKEQYYVLMKQVTELEGTGKFEDAVTMALKAKELNAKLPEADAAVKRLGSKLDDKQKEAINKMQAEQFNMSLTKAGELLKAEKYQDADDAIKKALAARPKDVAALELDTRIQAGLDLIRKGEQEKINRKNFDGFLQNARTFVDTDVDVERAIDKAKKSIADAKLLFPDDPAIKKVETLVLEKQEKQKIKARYDGLVEKANSALDEAKLDEASTYVAQALEVIPAGEQAQRVQRLVETKRKKINEENKNKEEQFNKMLADGKGYEKAGDLKPEWSSERVAQYETALAVFKRAKELKFPGGAAEKSEESIQSKLATAKTANAAKKQEFDAKLKQADTLNDSGDFDGALAALGTLKTGFDDKTVTEKESIYQVAKATSEKDIKTSLGRVQTAITARKLDDAMAEARKLGTRYSSRKDLVDIGDALTQIQGFGKKIEEKKAEARATFRNLDFKLNGRGSSQKTQFYAALDGLDALTGKALDQAVAAGFKNSETILKSLETEKAAQATRISGILADLEGIANTPVPVQQRDPVRTEQPKKNGGSSGVGETNVFDQ